MIRGLPLGKVIRRDYGHARQERRREYTFDGQTEMRLTLSYRRALSPSLTYRVIQPG